MPGASPPGSKPPGSKPPGSALPGSVPPGSALPGSVPPGSALPGSVPPGPALHRPVPPGPALRDFQRSRVYDAEHLVHRIFDRSGQFPVVDVAGSRITLPVERKFASIDSVQRYVDGVLGLAWVGATWERAVLPVHVRERSREGQAHYQRIGSIMAVPGYRAGSGWALRELVILHELAHHLAPDIESAHGGPFVDRLLTLVDGIVGPEAALLLRVTMLDVGVRIG